MYLTIIYSIYIYVYMYISFKRLLLFLLLLITYVHVCRVIGLISFCTQYTVHCVLCRPRIYRTKEGGIEFAHYLLWRLRNRSGTRFTVQNEQQLVNSESRFWPMRVLFSIQYHLFVCYYFLVQSNAWPDQICYSPFCMQTLYPCS